MLSSRASSFSKANATLTIGYELDALRLTLLGIMLTVGLPVGLGIGFGDRGVVLGHDFPPLTL
jgi:hypothetical protein